MQQNSAVPAPVKSQATTQLAGGVPFISDKQLKDALNKAHVPPRATDAIVEENAKARLDGLREALSILAIFALIGLAFSRRIPAEQPGSSKEPAPAAGNGSRSPSGRSSVTLPRSSREDLGRDG